MAQKKQAVPTEGIVLNKYIAHAGVCSRRSAIEIIKTGRVTVNQEVVTDPGYRVKPQDNVAVEGVNINPTQRKLYVLLNKPKDCVTTLSDERGRKTVADLISDKIPGRIFPIGRLDRNTTGILLLTNDGELANKLTHPRYMIEKVYHVTLDRNVGGQDMAKLKVGVQLEDGMIAVDDVKYVPQQSRNNVYVALHSGKYRVVRRMFEALGYKVTKLDRVGFAGLTKRGVRSGEWRYLSEEEVAYLQGLSKK